MPKRKREPSLEDRLAQWRKDLVRGLKTAKGFERQRLSKRLRDADAEKTARLEREIAVLKSLDLPQAAHAILCSSLLRIKGMAEAPKLPADIKQVPKPDLSEEEKTALHNVTSALCNRKHVKDVIEEAVMGTCIALRVPMPDKKGKGKGKDKEKEKKSDTAKNEKVEQADDEDMDVDGVEPDDQGEDEEDAGEDSELDGMKLLKRIRERAKGDSDLEDDEGSDVPWSPQFEGFSDSEAEERAFSRYDNLVGELSDEDEEESDEEGGSDDEEDLEDSRARSIRKAAADDISLSPNDSEQSSESESEDEALAPPPKKARMRAVNAAPVTGDRSAFLPTLMGGYISGSESASDVDVAPPMKKNRRGQRARQAIWDKKYGEKAKHHQKEKPSRDQGWDMKRGAVGDDDGGARPWKKGIRNPFEKSQVHPERQRQMQGGEQTGGSREQQGGYQGGEQGRGEGRDDRAKAKPKPKPPTRDDTGPLHPSWAAAKKAKEENQKVEFQGKKVVFD
ncbi:Uu.00g124900.m01.CDS01 [Anthostomella pinea]|uniref:Uu.00g124900.m01.CDS01 n=1 Tax=Anthostomella pinea TaxID=933095 RepID=A0AAI8VIC8_9PEZI|nr:Uu.00g124900.m01.CDS01 [Anthostomella pinea]